MVEQFCGKRGSMPPSRERRTVTRSWQAGRRGRCSQQRLSAEVSQVLHPVADDIAGNRGIKAEESPEEPGRGSRARQFLALVPDERQSMGEARNLGSPSWHGMQSDRRLTQGYGPVMHSPQASQGVAGRRPWRDERGETSMRGGSRLMTLQRAHSHHWRCDRHLMPFRLHLPVLPSEAMKLSRMVYRTHV